jgi:uncharacterized protein YukE
MAANSGTMLSVSFPNMQQLYAEISSVVGQTGATLEELIARLNSTLGPEENWGGLTKQLWAEIQREWNQLHLNLNQITTGIGTFVDEVGSNLYPTTEAQNQARFHSIS